ncbi:MAG: TonB family protein [Bacteroidales bacterium]|nr:TonB family protein [Bacteroidales bacterium]
METKKSHKANLENKKGLFFELGLVIVLSLVLIAFEWSGNKKDLTNLIRVSNTIADEELIINTIQEKKIPLPKEPAVPEFKILDNSSDIEEDIIEINVDVKPWDFVDFNNDETEAEEALPFFRVEELPSFRNGDINSFNKYIQGKLRYSPEAINLGLEGRIFIQFVVDKKGNVTKVQIQRGIDPLLDNQVIEVMENSPKWKPGKQRDKAVDVVFTMSVLFKLEKSF